MIELLVVDVSTYNVFLIDCLWTDIHFLDLGMNKK
jgi:hypothetical protein